MPFITVKIDFHGIPLTVSGRYRPAEPDVGVAASFELHAVKASVFAAGSYRLEDLDEEGVTSEALDYLEAEALSTVEAGFEAAACEAAAARAEARRDAQQSD